jgi:GAF domain-containing protein
MPDLKRDQLVLVEAVGPAAAALRGLRIEVGEGITGWVAANRQVITNAAAIDLGERSRAFNPPLATCLSVPLLSGDSMVGVVTLYASEKDVFNDATARLVQMVAPHLAQAIHLVGPSSPAKTEPIEKPQTGRELRLVSVH